MNFKWEIIERILMMWETLDLDEELELFWGQFDKGPIVIFLLFILGDWNIVSSPNMLSCVETEDD